MKRNKITFLIVVFLFLLSIGTAYSVVLPGDDPAKDEQIVPTGAPGSFLLKGEDANQENALPKTVPGEIILKLKPDIIEFPKGKTEANINEIKFNSSSLQTLFIKYNVNDVEKVFKSLDTINETVIPPEKQATIERLRDRGLPNVIKIKVEDKDVKSIIKELRKNPDVIYAEPNYIYTVQLVPNDPYYSNQWAHWNMHSAAGWDITTGSPNIKIAIIDVGVDWDHEDLQANIWQNLAEDADNDGHTMELVGNQWVLDPGDLNGIDDDGNGYIDDLIGWDTVDIDLQYYLPWGFSQSPGEDYTVPDNNPYGVNGHGTHCAGIADAVGNNATGVVGVSWNSKILPIRAGFQLFLGTFSYGLLEDDDIAQAITYAIITDVDIISMSFGGTGESNLMYDAIQAAYNENIILIAAAGNSDSQTFHFPAAYEEVCAVAATTILDIKAAYSNYGVWVDVSAPGSSIYSTILNNNYGYLSGTSMACPHVAGLAALVKAKYETLNPTRNAILNTIINSAYNIDAFNPSYVGLLGGGRIHVENALEVPLIEGTPADKIIYLHTTETQNFSVNVYNLNGNPVTYSWELDGVVVSTAPTYQFTASQIGNNTLKVTVTLDGQTNFYEWTITIAPTLTVGPEGSGANFTSIEAAIDAANPGDMVLVLPGEYYIDDPINVNKDLTIKSEGGPGGTTLLVTTNLSSSEYVFLIMTGTTSATAIEGFTIISAQPSSPPWHGFLCQVGTHPTIENNVIQGSGSGSSIRGIDVNNNAGALIKNNLISGFSHGIYLVNSSESVEILNCTIYNNTYGIYVSGLASVEMIANCIINNNNYGIKVSGSDAIIPLIVNSAVVYNTVAGIKLLLGGHVTSLKNSIVYGSNQNLSGAPDSVTYSDIGGASVYPGVGNINAEPLFVDLTNNDYHLQPGSPCIDAGDPDPIYNDPEDPTNPGMALYPSLGAIRNDMGAYGGPNVLPGSITITYPQEGAIIETFTPTITWSTSAISPNESLRLIISHPLPGASTPKMSLKSGCQRFFAQLLDLLDVKSAYAYGINSTLQLVIWAIDLDVVVPNTGSYTVPNNILSLGINYRLQLYKETTPSIYDTVHFSVTQEVIPVPPK